MIETTIIISTRVKPLEEFAEAGFFMPPFLATERPPPSRKRRVFL
jgi:hypothetical protein